MKKKEKTRKNDDKEWEKNLKHDEKGEKTRKHDEKQRNNNQK